MNEHHTIMCKYSEPIILCNVKNSLSLYKYNVYKTIKFNTKQELDEKKMKKWRVTKKAVHIKENGYGKKDQW